MKALVANATWAPRPGYKPTEEEVSRQRAYCGSSVWKDPVFEVKDVPTPDPEDDEVLIRVSKCGVCGSDTHLIERDPEGYIIFSALTKFPCVLGHEFSGTIEAVGRLVRNLKKGDLVAVESVMWCGLCRMCRSGAPNQCENVDLLGLSRNGAFAEYASVPERFCWKINELKDAYPEDKVFEAGALIEPVGCAYNGLFVAGGGFLPGSTVAVFGAGPIGLGAIALAKTAGAALVIAFDVNDERVKIARAVGADAAYNVATLKDGPASVIRELTAGRGADVQVEAAGAATKTIPEMEKSMASQGRIIYLGRAATKTPVHLDQLVTGANKIIGARGHAGYGIFPYIISLMAKKRLDIVPMVSSRYPFSSVLDALNASIKRTDSKILVNIG